MTAHHQIELWVQILLAIPFVIGILLYTIASRVKKNRYQRWPFYRYVFFYGGSIMALLSVIGPLAEAAHMSFYTHMQVHLLLGMAAPLLMALGAPVTLFLRALPVKNAKVLTSVLRSSLIRYISHPTTALILNIGGLWLIYTTDLYPRMMVSPFWHILIHIHVFAAGYLFTVAIIYTDPVAHRSSYRMRATILLVALALHGILSKYIYAHPPSGVMKAEAETGSMLMYYGGDFVDAVLIFLLCRAWYLCKNRSLSYTIARTE